jgi:mRNA-degrading endonuclease RelE of RelBE toxin-antitoxin system
MVNVVYHPQFLKSAQKLPPAQRQKLAVCIEFLQENPYHPLLHSKRLSEPLLGLLSFRITRDWRVIFSFLDEKTIQLIAVEHRRDIYRR